MDNENQNLRKLIRARKQARPNKQNTDSGDTDSYENTAESGNFAKGNSTAKFNSENLANAKNTAEFGNENLANSDTNTQNFTDQNTANLNNQNPKNSNNQNPHLNLRDYDKDPLILRDYSCGALGTLHIFVIVFWIVSAVFIFNKTGDYNNGRQLDMSDITTTIVAFSLISAVILICISLWLSASVSSDKVKYIYYYNSKVEDRDEKNQVTGTITFVNGYERCKYKMTSSSFIKISFLRVNILFQILIVLIMLCFFNMNFMGIFLLILISLITAFLEILAYMPMYKKINGNLKNFWKNSRKLSLEFTFARSYLEADDNISIYLFDQKRHDEIRDYILKVFFYDIDDKNLINYFL